MSKDNLPKMSEAMVSYLLKLSKPHVLAEDITQLNFKKMKEFGMQKVIFDKFNTLVCHGEYAFFEDAFEMAFYEAEKVFGEENVFMSANLNPGKI